jgi:tetratricopeptide (TPR) repeat protein
MVARDLDPFSLIVNTNVGWVLDRAGRHDEAIAHLEQTLVLDSLYVQAHWRLADALASAGRYAEAIDRADRVVVLTDSSAPAVALRAHIGARAGRREEARQMLETLLSRSRRQYVPPSSIGDVYAALGDVDTAVTWLEKAFDERSNAVAYLADPGREGLRSHPRFRALLARAGLE